MKLIRIFAHFVRGSASPARARRPLAVTVPAPRVPAVEAAPAIADAAAARLTDFRCSVPLRPAPAEPPTLRS